MWSQIYNGNQMIGTNAISFLQVIQNDFARLEVGDHNGRVRSDVHF